MKKLIVLLIMLTTNSVCLANNVSNAKIKKIMMDQNYSTKVYIVLDKSQASLIACHSNSSWQYVVDTGTEFGKQLYSILMILYTTGKSANFIGKNNCDVYFSIESLRRIELLD